MIYRAKVNAAMKLKVFRRVMLNELYDGHRFSAIKSEVHHARKYKNHIPAFLKTINL